MAHLYGDSIIFPMVSYGIWAFFFANTGTIGSDKIRSQSWCVGVWVGFARVHHDEHFLVEKHSQTQSTRATQNTQNAQSTQNTQNTENTKNTKNKGKTQNTQQQGHRTQNTKHRTHSTQHSTQHTANRIQRTTYNAQHTTHNTHHATRNAQHTTQNARTHTHTHIHRTHAHNTHNTHTHTTQNRQPTAYNTHTQHTQHTTNNIQNATHTHNTQHTAHNTHTKGKNTPVRGLGRVHLVDSDNQLLHTKGVGKKGVLARLAVLGNTSLELADTSGNNQHGAVGLQKSRKVKRGEVKGGLGREKKKKKKKKKLKGPNQTSKEEPFLRPLRSHALGFTCFLFAK